MGQSVVASGLCLLLCSSAWQWVTHRYLGRCMMLPRNQPATAQELRQRRRERNMRGEGRGPTLPLLPIHSTAAKQPATDTPVRSSPRRRTTPKPQRRATISEACLRTMLFSSSRYMIIYDVGIYYVQQGLPNGVRRECSCLGATVRSSRPCMARRKPCALLNAPGSVPVLQYPAHAGLRLPACTHARAERHCRALRQC